MLIGLCGRKRSGKDSAANLLVEKHGFTKLAFADPLKKLVAKAMTVTEECVRSNEFKDLTYWEGLRSTSLDGLWLKAQHYVTGRQMLQRLGQACRDTFGQDFWVKQTMKLVGDRRICGDCGVGREEHGLWRDGQIYGCERFIERIYSTGAPVLDKRDYVVSDVRYWSELRAIKNAGGIIIRLNREDRQFRHDFYKDATPHGHDTLCDYTFPDGNWCGMEKAAHPSHYSGDTHSSETELPDASPEYSAIFQCASEIQAAANVESWVNEYREVMR
jgi:hypothetical protein